MFFYSRFIRYELHKDFDLVRPKLSIFFPILAVPINTHENASDHRNDGALSRSYFQHCFRTILTPDSLREGILSVFFKFSSVFSLNPEAMPIYHTLGTDRKSTRLISSN